MGLDPRCLSVLPVLEQRREISPTFKVFSILHGLKKVWLVPGRNVTDRESEGKKRRASHRGKRKRDGQGK
jgi:hypothetical protein